MSSLAVGGTRTPRRRLQIAPARCQPAFPYPITATMRRVRQGQGRIAGYLSLLPGLWCAQAFGEQLPRIGRGQRDDGGRGGAPGRLQLPASSRAGQLPPSAHPHCP
ncbi:hypothetical protein [Hymenobacter siberiensis]|jgi:hypothetical protein|uniref:hypothetical protein n=1 Tax=Hymenobacter siberiensis TaxID=2848396 RepID=UPI001C1E8674|nr:hypothetical protein [Hymenobacter siberiensis]